MKTLIIYDNTGYIYFQMGTTYIVPQGGLNYLEVEVPEGKRITGVNVSVIPNVAILEDIPKTQEEINQEQIKSLGEQLTQEKLKNIEKDKAIESIGKELAQIKLQSIQNK